MNACDLLNYQAVSILVIFEGVCNWNNIITCFRKISKNNYYRRHVCLSATQLPLDNFSWNLIFEYFSKICRENLSLIKVGQEKRALCTKSNVLYFYHISLNS